MSSKRMGQTSLVVYGRSSEGVEEVLENIEGFLKKKGVGWKGPITYPVAPAHEIKAASKMRRPIEDEKYNWLKQLSRDGLKNMLVSGNPRLHGRSIQFQSRIGVEEEDVLSTLDLEGAVAVESSTDPVESQDMKNAPFSYDPEQDYKTEP